MKREGVYLRHAEWLLADPLASSSLGPREIQHYLSLLSQE